MKNKKETRLKTLVIAIIVVISVGIIVVHQLRKPFNKDIENMKKAISSCNLKEAARYYEKAAEEKFKDKSALYEASIWLGEGQENAIQYNQGLQVFNQGMVASNEKDYKQAIEDFQFPRTNGFAKKSKEDLNIATTKFLNEKFEKLEPEIKAKHYMDAYNELQNESAFIVNNSIVEEYLNRIKALENENNLNLYKATGIALKKVNEIEVDIQTMVGVVNNNYITYSYPTGKINFITKEQNGVIDGQEGFLFLVKQVEREGNSLNYLNGYYYVFVNMDSGKVNIYDKSILNNFKPTFKVVEFNGGNPVASSYMKEFNIPNCFMALQDLLRKKDINKITHLESLYNETKFINEVKGYKELYNKPHQLFLVYGNEYYLVTPEEIYMVKGNKLIKEGKTILNPKVQTEEV